MLDGFNQNQIRDILKGFKYDTMNGVGGEGGERRRYV